MLVVLLSVFVFDMYVFCFFLAFMWFLVFSGHVQIDLERHLEQAKTKKVSEYGLEIPQSQTADTVRKRHMTQTVTRQQ